MNTLYQMPDYAVQQTQSKSHAANYTNMAPIKPRPGGRKANLPKPKRATSAYVYFSQHYREMLKKEGRPVPRISEFGKECAAKWNVMNEKEKEPFAQLAAHDKARYASEIAAIRPKRDANKPKRPGTAFMLFMMDFRKEMAGREPAGGVAAMAKLGGERWRNMTDLDKKPYVDRQNVEKTKYDINMEQYKSSVSMGNSPPQAGLVQAVQQQQQQVASQQQQSQSIPTMQMGITGQGAQAMSGDGGGHGMDDGDGDDGEEWDSEEENSESDY